MLSTHCGCATPGSDPLAIPLDRRGFPTLFLTWNHLYTPVFPAFKDPNPLIWWWQHDSTTPLCPNHLLTPQSNRRRQASTISCQCIPNLCAWESFTCLDTRQCALTSLCDHDHPSCISYPRWGPTNCCWWALTPSAKFANQFLCQHYLFPTQHVCFTVRMWLA